MVENGVWQQRAVGAKSVPGVLSRAECDALIARAGESGLSRAKVLRSGESLVSAGRTNERAALPRTPDVEWLYDRIMSATQEVNRELWRFEITGIDAIEVLRYRPGQKFDWHFDTHGTLRRKITCVINLSDPASYWRGGLVLRAAHLEKKRSREQGAATLFPSYIQHRARPPLWGTRWSLVAWLTGPQWR